MREVAVAGQYTPSARVPRGSGARGTAGGRAPVFIKKLKIIYLDSCARMPPGRPGARPRRTPPPGPKVLSTGIDSPGGASGEPAT